MGGGAIDRCPSHRRSVRIGGQHEDPGVLRSTVREPCGITHGEVAARRPGARADTPAIRRS